MEGLSGEFSSPVCKPRDYRGLGETAFIGKPKQPTFTVCQLVGEEYAQQQFRLGEFIASPMLEGLQLQLDQILPR